MLKHIVALTFSTLLLCHAAAAQSPFDVMPSRYSFLPVLTTNTDPAVCGAYFAALTAAYKGPDFDIDITGRPLPGLDARWIISAADIGAAAAHDATRAFLQPVQEFHGFPRPGDFLTSASVDVDGDGSDEVLAITGLQDVQFWMHYKLMLFDDLDQFGSYVTAPGGEIEHRELRLPGIWGVTPSVVRIDGVLYLSDNPQEIDADDVEAGLWRLTAAGEIILACKVALVPDGLRDSPIPSMTEAPIEAFNTELLRVQGRDVCSGSMHYIDNIELASRRLGHRLALRPWALAKFETWNNMPEVEAGLDRWGLQSLWNLRTLRSLRKARPDAEQGLATYYRDTFGLEETGATALSAAAVELLTRSQFHFSARPLVPDPDEPTYQLHVALLRNESPARIEQLLKAEAKISNVFSKSPLAYQAEPTLFYGLEAPALVDKLLEHGADANARGNFNKTALMYAAQFNLPETARRLLAHGADANRATNLDIDCGLVQTAGRTALMYAAENGTTEMLQLLLDHGADPVARDSRGRLALDYVERNSAVEPGDREQMKRLLGEAAARNTKPAP